MYKIKSRWADCISLARCVTPHRVNSNILHEFPCPRIDISRATSRFISPCAENRYRINNKKKSRLIIVEHHQESTDPIFTPSNNFSPEKRIQFRDESSMRYIHHTYIYIYPDPRNVTGQPHSSFSMIMTLDIFSSSAQYNVVFFSATQELSLYNGSPFSLFTRQQIYFSCSAEQNPRRFVEVNRQQCDLVFLRISRHS